MTKPSSILLFAAGLGTRMGDLVRTKPKPLISVFGKPLLDHALDLTEGTNITRRVVNTHFMGAQIVAHLNGRDIQISDESDLLRETGGGLLHALPLLGSGPTFTMNSDAVWQGPNPIQLIQDAWSPHMEALLMMVPMQRAKGHRGDGDFFINQDGQLKRGPGHIYTGLQIIRTDRFNDIADRVFSMNIVWDEMAKSGGLYGVTYPGRWCDVGQPESIAIAEDMLRQPVDV